DRRNEPAATARAGRAYLQTSKVANLSNSAVGLHWTGALLALLILTVGGWLLVGLLMWAMRKHVFGRTPHKERSSGALDLWLGSTERVVAAVMVVWCVSYLPGFIGACSQTRGQLAADKIRYRQSPEREL